ncbi:hypothetical protein CMO89_03275 [Candidatus Woesearchaeota archaeon]|nr:hypothetical protein [Candidatus Woesearchaeota archaeon]
MNTNRAKITAAFGTILAFLGGIGAYASSIGLCACTLAPIFSFVGIISIIVSFLSENKLFFLVTGIILLIISFIFYKKKKVCRIHKKAKRK